MRRNVSVKKSSTNNRTQSNIPKISIPRSGSLEELGNEREETTEINSGLDNLALNLSLTRTRQDESSQCQNNVDARTSSRRNVSARKSSTGDGTQSKIPSVSVKISRNPNPDEGLRNESGKVTECDFDLSNLDFNGRQSLTRQRESSPSQNNVDARASSRRNVTVRKSSANARKSSAGNDVPPQISNVSVNHSRSTTKGLGMGFRNKSGKTTEFNSELDNLDLNDKETRQKETSQRENNVDVKKSSSRNGSTIKSGMGNFSVKVSVNKSNTNNRTQSNISVNHSSADQREFGNESRGGTTEFRDDLENPDLNDQENLTRRQSSPDQNSDHRNSEEEDPEDEDDPTTSGQLNLPDTNISISYREKKASVEDYEANLAKSRSEPTISIRKTKRHTHKGDKEIRKKSKKKKKKRISANSNPDVSKQRRKCTFGTRGGKTILDSPYAVPERSSSIPARYDPCDYRPNNDRPSSPAPAISSPCGCMDYNLCVAAPGPGLLGIQLGTLRIIEHSEAHALSPDAFWMNLSPKFLCVLNRSLRRKSFTFSRDLNYLATGEIRRAPTKKPQCSPPKSKKRTTWSINAMPTRFHQRKNGCSSKPLRSTCSPPPDSRTNSIQLFHGKGCGPASTFGILKHIWNQRSIAC